jgi:ribose transport system permease protein
MKASAEVGKLEVSHAGRFQTKPGGIVERAGLVRFSGLYGLVLVVLIFWVALPNVRWISTLNVQVILSEAALSGFFALAALIPLTAGMLDLQFANVGGFGLALMSYLAIRTSIPDAVLIVIVVVCSALFGLASGLIVSRLNLSSLLVTLGMSSIALAATQYILHGQPLYPTSHFSQWFKTMTTGYAGLFPIAFLILTGVGVTLYIWIEHTPPGRRLLATGASPVGARLAGINVGRFQVLSLTLASALGGFTGVLMAGMLGTADDVTAPLYLLPAIAALFLGTTQVKFRLNVAGTFIAVMLLQVATHGFELAGINNWVTYVFDGAILLMAVIVSRGRLTLHV